MKVFEKQVGAWTVKEISFGPNDEEATKLGLGLDEYASCLTPAYQKVKFLRREWRKKGELDRQNAPAVTMWQIHGKKKIMISGTYYRNGKLHREDGAALRRWTAYDGKRELIEEKYYHKGLLHRRDGPASTGYWGEPDGGNWRFYRRCIWYRYGKIHNDNGAAIVTSMKMHDGKWKVIDEMDGNMRMYRN